MMKTLRWLMVCHITLIILYTVFYTNNHSVGSKATQKNHHTPTIRTGDTREANITLTSFNNNSAELSGGALHLKDSKPVLAHSLETGEASIQIHVLLLFRIWDGDRFGMTTQNLIHWISYMKDIGGAHVVHAYENCYPISQCTGLGEYWPEQDYFKAQYTAYADAQAKIRSQNTTWIIQMDLDEFPFMPNDLTRGFLHRYITNLDPEVTQVLLPCVFFGGNPETDDFRLPVKFTHRMPNPEQGRTKPLFRIDAADTMRYREVHGMQMKKGSTITADPNVLRMNHYWGGRIAQSQTVDTSLRDWLLSLP